MDIERAFLDDIIANPDDDAPRLVYADWLTDAGDDAAADFIRAQVEMATLDVTHPRYDELEGVEMRLAPRAERSILRRCGAPEYAGLRRMSWRFRRGMPEGCVLMDAAVFALEFESLIKTVPLTEVGLAEVHLGVAETVACLIGRSRIDSLVLEIAREPLVREPNAMALLLTGGHLERISSLRVLTTIASSPALADWIEGRPMRALGLIPYHGRRSLPPLLNRLRPDLLECLWLTGNTLRGGVAEMSDVLSSPSCRGLRTLEASRVFGSNPAFAGVLPLLELSRTPPALGRVNLSGNRLHPEDRSSLAALQHLQSLSLSGCNLTADSLDFLDALSTPTLRELDLTYNDLGPAGLRRLCRAPTLAGLRSLSLNRLYATAENVDALLSAPFFAGLRRLALGDSFAKEPDAVRRILDAARDTELTHVDFGDSDEFSPGVRDAVGKFRASRGW